MYDGVHVGNWLIDIRFFHVFLFFDSVGIDLLDFLAFDDVLLIPHALTTLSKNII